VDLRELCILTRNRSNRAQKLSVGVQSRHCAIAIYWRRQRRSADPGRTRSGRRKARSERVAGIASEILLRRGKDRWSVYWCRERAR